MRGGERHKPPSPTPHAHPSFHISGLAILTFCRGAPWGRTGVSRDRKTLWLICSFWSWRKRRRTRRRTCCCPWMGARRRHCSRPLLRCRPGSCAGAWTWCRRPRAPATRRACWTSCVFSLDGTKVKGQTGQIAVGRRRLNTELISVSRTEELTSSQPPH